MILKKKQYKTLLLRVSHYQSSGILLFNAKQSR